MAIVRSLTLIRSLTLTLALSVTVFGTPSTNMNGVNYRIANPNPNSPKNFSGDYAEYSPNSKFFEVYSPMISTRYGQVYWTRMDAVPLPPDIVAQFKGKVMAITGYESDQVRRTPDGDVPLPITAAYNHHYTGYVNSNNAKLQKVTNANTNPQTMGHADSDGEFWEYIDTRPPHARTGPASIALHEGNGSEYRLSFHGFANGFAQFIESPETFVFNPMQIDTWNRDNTNMSGFWPGPAPKNSEAPLNAPYSGLLECPCTDRITKKVDATIVAQVEGHCADAVQSATACSAAGIKALELPWTVASHSGSNASMPPGCSLTVGWDATTNRPLLNDAVAFFNTDTTSTVSCDSYTQQTHLFGAADIADTGVSNLGVWVEVTDTMLRVTLDGPSDVWFGLGLNASTMAAGTYAVIVDGDGNVTERTLGAHEGGVQLPNTLTIETNKQTNNRRLVVVSRPITQTSTFGLSVNSLKETAQLHLIAATGSSGTFGYHKSKGSFEVSMVNVDSPTCICETNQSVFGKGTGYLTYTPPAGEPGSSTSKVPGAGVTTLRFQKDCLKYPASTMLLGKNPSCDIRAYTGGQSCCHHLVTLLDKDQQTPWIDQALEYQFKWRIYYQEADAPLSNVVQHNWGGIASPTEFDVPKCADGVYGCSFENGEWVHRINGTWTVAQMTGGVAFTPVVIHGHCHAPTCIDFTLYNADTNETICKQVPSYGTSNKTFDEKGYIYVPPCVFGSPADGLMPIPNISATTNLFSVKTSQANSGHHGEMSLWQTYCSH